jgi:multiple sugar transport system ATP-binding protein
MPRVAYEHVEKSFGPVTVLQDFDLQVDDGELAVLVGGSGSGKSTALRLLAGLETPTRGTLRIGERDVTRLAPRDRDVAMVFQDYALYPHLDVRENVALGLRLRRMPAAEIERRLSWVAETLALGALLDRKPRALSGGQRQRVAMARAMVREPAVFLFDEPLSNLDAHLRGQVRVEISQLQKRLGTTALYVTHDQVEAMTLADRLVVLEGGRIQQVGRPLDVYREPENRFVAGFIGSPPMNFVSGRVSGGAFEAEGLRVPLTEAGAAAVALGIRPEDLRLVPEGESHLSGRVHLREVLGATAHLHVESGPHRLTVVVPSDLAPSPGEVVHLAARRPHLFAADGRAVR